MFGDKRKKEYEKALARIDEYADRCEDLATKLIETQDMLELSEREKDIILDRALKLDAALEEALKLLKIQQDMLEGKNGNTEVSGEIQDPQS